MINTYLTLYIYIYYIAGKLDDRICTLEGVQQKYCSKERFDGKLILAL